ncbi:uncharacterized protein PV07_08814 [Cladophialophora immunda]|uniref:Uncharacterized protein n=1 Tax=Cladophialophora immunda TaxID=569365 RepID=A0A0D2C356_9EURO|nr:uncharacterized protein PV07_08814 [Cladophialophora immunda]KIW25648.1 hypothetical protein PV07_08814 [Cladophialophora immunda]
MWSSSPQLRQTQISLFGQSYGIILADFAGTTTTLPATVSNTMTLLTTQGASNSRLNTCDSFFGATLGSVTELSAVVALVCFTIEPNSGISETSKIFFWRRRLFVDEKGTLLDPATYLDPFVRDCVVLNDSAFLATTIMFDEPSQSHFPLAVIIRLIISVTHKPDPSSNPNHLPASERAIPNHLDDSPVAYNSNEENEPTSPSYNSCSIAHDDAEFEMSDAPLPPPDKAKPPSLKIKFLSKPTVSQAGDHCASEYSKDAVHQAQTSRRSSAIASLTT